MSKLDQLKQQQSEIVEIVGVLRGMMSVEQLKVTPIAKVAHSLLCDLCTKMRSHLAAEDGGIYPALLTFPDPDIKNLAWGFINNDKPLRKQFDAYSNQWLKNCDINFCEEFIAETLEIFDVVEQRLNREMLSMLPRIERSGVFAQLQ